MSPENVYSLRFVSTAAAAAYVKCASLPRLRSPGLGSFCGAIGYYFVSIFFLIIFFFSPAWGAEAPNPKLWEPLSGNFYIHKKIITKSPGILLVWTYSTIPADVRGKTVEDVKKYNPEKAVRYQDYRSATILWEIDCNRKLIRTEEFIDFNGKGEVIDRLRSTSSEWTEVAPGTGANALFRKACLPPQKKPVKKKKVQK